MPLPRVLATDLLKHRAIHKAKNGGKRVYLIFWVNFRTGEIIDSLTHSNLTCDKFLCYETNKHYEEYTII
jgi:hypothetical protein